MSSEMRGVMFRLKDSGMKVADISRNTDRPHSTVSSIIKSGYPYRPPTKRGRKAILNAREVRILIRAGKAHRFATAQEILDMYDLNSIKPGTANKIWNKAGLKGRKPRKKPFLKPMHRRRRNTWATKYRHWTVSRWRKGSYTDETTFELGKPDGSKTVRRAAGEELNDDCITPSFKSGRTSVSFWGAVSATGKSKLIIIEGRLNATQYCESILKGELAEFYALQKAVHGPTAFIVEDNCPAHRAKVCEKLKKE